MVVTEFLGFLDTVVSLEDQERSYNATIQVDFQVEYWVRVDAKLHCCAPFQVRRSQHARRSIVLGHLNSLLR